MLECGKNFKGSLKETCAHCNVLDDESHRLNYCEKLKEINLFDSNNGKVDFRDVFSSDVKVLRNIIPHIEKVWNVKTAHGNIYR